MSQSKGRKVKSLGSREQEDVFWMSLDEAKQAIIDKYEFLADRYERKLSKGKGA